ncbi:helix-turn-helix domain-containing protein [Roseomonas sp. HJA6]|uniref:Helix-turn-helix domain-containing protein n=1 Tax=Roseomonas alba TaxID=2846776 RepID=A0ABS7ABG8_9PROT|nr:helix-turn-helix domain-containing protein [Neoroseomonas alba]MBW6399518.1 helix-turn-helix domain-containing protein [Neoroseomonas alba]
MSSLSFSTRDLPARDQHEAWRSWFYPVFDLAWSPGETLTSFEADITTWMMGGTTLSRVVAPPLHSIRNATHVRRNPTDHWVIAVGKVPSNILMEHEDLQVAAGTAFLLSLGDPVQSAREADDRLHLYLPRDRFTSLAPILDRAKGKLLQGGLGCLLSDYLHLLERSLPGLNDAEIARLPDAIEAMVAACIAPESRSSGDASAQIDFTRLDRVRQAVRRRLHSATLTPVSLGRDVGMSRSQLYRLLEGEGGVIRYIQRQRLRAIHAALSDPKDERPIAVVAESCGFYEPSTFSRTFRREFGVTPSDVRAAARAGLVLAQEPRPVMLAETMNLSECLRAF